jgi:hypothetical protein
MKRWRADRLSDCAQRGRGPGRLFYEAAQESPLEIRPLQLFYGMLGFSKALVLARRVVSMSTLPQTHGVSDISEANCRIADLKVHIGNRGVFQEANDVFKELNRLCYFGESSKPASILLPSSSSMELAGISLSLRQILGRIPGLESLFFETFGEVANTASLDLNYPHSENRWELRIWDSNLCGNRDSLLNMIEGWRLRYPWLRKWSMVSAQHAWGKSLITFVNRNNLGTDELEDPYLVGAGDQYEVQGHPAVNGPGPGFEIAQGVSPFAGGYPGTGSSYAISPITETIYPSEFSMHFLALFLLSSLVRYRPHIWSHAISRTSVSEAPADDAALALIERYLHINMEAIPAFVVTVLNPNEDQFE